VLKKAFLDILGAYSIKYRDFAILKRPDDFKYHKEEEFTTLAPEVFAAEKDEKALDALKELKDGINE
jgi:hypothetical protein